MDLPLLFPSSRQGGFGALMLPGVTSKQEPSVLARVKGGWLHPRVP